MFFHRLHLSRPHGAVGATGLPEDGLDFVGVSLEVRGVQIATKYNVHGFDELASNLPHSQELPLQHRWK